MNGPEIRVSPSDQSLASMSTLKSPTSSTSPLPPPGRSLSDAVLLPAGVACALIPQYVRATTNISVFPDWDLNPLVYPLRTPGIGPAMSMLVDAVSMLGAAMLLLVAARSSSAPRSDAVDRRYSMLGLGVAAMALCAGVVGVLAHTHLSVPASIGDLRIGASWVAAVVCGLGVSQVARMPHARRLLAAVLLGFIALLALRAAQQVFIEHPQTLASFRADRERVLASHGWNPGSPMALGFERRLSQPEASGWFGLSNVFASFSAATAVALAGLLLARRSAVHTLVLVVGMLAAVGCVLLAGGKGGVLAMLIGLAMLPLFAFARRGRGLTRLAAALPAMAIAGALALVALRGLIGERIGELSILFRWFYIQAATRIFVQHPLVGVGPDGFQQAFLLAKPPLCPEEVTSPHSIAFDWTATLGVFGLGWVVLLIFAAYRIGRVGASPSAGHVRADATRADFRVACAIPIVATLIVIWFESPLIVPEMALVRVFGLLGWCGLAWFIMRSWSDRPATIGLSAAAVALLAHAQIEVTASYASSAPLWAMLIGLAAAGCSDSISSPPQSATGPDRAFRTLLAGVAIVLALAFAWPALTRVRAWEAHLRASADLVRVIPAFGERVMALGTPSGQTPYSTVRETPEGIARDLSAVLQRVVPVTREGLQQAMLDLELRQLGAAHEHLRAAGAIDPADRRPVRELSTLHMRQAEIAALRGDASGVVRAVDDALGAMGIQAPPPAKAGDWMWQATLQERAASSLLSIDPARATRLLMEAIGSRERCAALDPYNLPNVVALARLTDRVHHQDKGKAGGAAAAWARRALELDRFARLDAAVRGLSDGDRRAMTQLLGDPEPSPEAGP